MTIFSSTASMVKPSCMNRGESSDDLLMLLCQETEGAQIFLPFFICISSMYNNLHPCTSVVKSVSFVGYYVPSMSSKIHWNLNRIYLTRLQTTNFLFTLYGNRRLSAKYRLPPQHSARPTLDSNGRDRQDQNANGFKFSLLKINAKGMFTVQWDWWIDFFRLRHSF